MNNQKWYDKATVQAAFVNGIPAILTAFIAILTLVTTCNNSNSQLDLFEKQYLRDSTNSALQMELLLKQIDITNRSYLNDSIISAQELEIAKIQLNQIIAESKTKETTNLTNIRYTLLEIFDAMPSKGIIFVKEYTMEERIELAAKLEKLFSKELNNPILINNKQCFGYWTSAYNSVRLLNDIEAQPVLLSDQFLPGQLTLIFNNIVKVHLELILHKKIEK